MKGRRRAGELPILGTLRLGIADAGRHARLGACLCGGSFERLQTQGWWLLVSTLLLIPLAGALMVLFGQGDQITPARVLLAFFGLLILRWLIRTRGRVVVESFVDFTQDEAKAVSGLSTLLVIELGRLRELYQQIDDLSVPTAVGVETHGGFGRGKEAGVFLTVSADDATNVLEDAVASDAGITLGPAKISLKPILTFIHRVTRGPRVVGSVHLTEAGGGPTLTAQYLSKGKSMTWRIDQQREPESPEERKAFLDTMVRELACQMFSQLTLQGSVRWKAVESFNEYLRLYGEARRTPRDRAHLLKQAQGELLKAVAEDERFDLAYYNLGVIYMQLAHTERLAEQEAEDMTARLNFDRSELDSARGEAAQVAFERALAKNSNRWEAYYALAVTLFSQIEVQIDDPAPKDEKAGRLRAVVALCEQALSVAPDRHANLAAIYDLRGMAQTRLAKNFRKALKSHRLAVYHSWVEYCRARQRDASRPDGMPDLVAHAKANATASLHNLALAYERRELRGRGAGDLLRAQQIFRRAQRLAGDGSPGTAASRFERGGALERAGSFKQAGEEFKRAARIHTRSAEYHARCAQAYAGHWRKLTERKADDPDAKSPTRKARRYALLALDLLAQPFSQAVLPFGPDAVALRCEATLQSLDETYERLGDEVGREWIAEIQGLWQAIGGALGFATESPREGDEAGAFALEADRLAALRSQSLERRPKPEIQGEALPIDPEIWQLDQVELAMGRLYAEARDWHAAGETFDALVERLTKEKRTKRLVEFGAYAHQARAQRELDHFVTALETAAMGIRRAPLAIEARREAGRAHFALGQFSDALDAWTHALWLSPSDPYLHYEMAMCHRALLRDQTDVDKRQRQLECTKIHFTKAQELFDGEDLDGEAWSRFWRGKIALEAGDVTAGIEHLKGATHGTARAAAELLLGEGYLSVEKRAAALRAFASCTEALTEKGQKSELPGRDTIDALWGDELPIDEVRARIARGEAMPRYLLSVPFHRWRRSNGAGHANGAAPRALAPPSP